MPLPSYLLFTFLSILEKHWPTIIFDPLGKKWMKTRSLLDWGFWCTLDPYMNLAPGKRARHSRLKTRRVPFLSDYSPTRDTHHQIADAKLWPLALLPPERSPPTQAPSPHRRLSFSQGNERNKLQVPSCSYFGRRGWWGWGGVWGLLPL